MASTQAAGEESGASGAPHHRCSWMSPAEEEAEAEVASEGPSPVPKQQSRASDSRQRPQQRPDLQQGASSEGKMMDGGIFFGGVIVILVKHD